MSFICSVRLPDSFSGFSFVYCGLPLPPLSFTTCIGLKRKIFQVCWKKIVGKNHFSFNSPGLGGTLAGEKDEQVGKGRAKKSEEEGRKRMHRAYCRLGRRHISTPERQIGDYTTTTVFWFAREKKKKDSSPFRNLNKNKNQQTHTHRHHQQIKRTQQT